MQYDVSDFCDEVAERYVLNEALNDINYYYTLTTKLTKSDFLDPRHGFVFSALKILIEKYDVSAFDFFEVERQLEAMSATDMVDAKYLEVLYNFKGSSENFENNINKVLEASAKYRLFRSLNNTSVEILEDLGPNKKNTADFIGKVQTSILEVSTKSKSIHEPINVCEDIFDYVEERRKNDVDMSGLSTGYPILDTQIDGLIPGTLFVVAARKKMGKSAFLTNMAGHIALTLGKPVLYVDTEMTFPEWRNRLIACAAGVPERVVKRGGYDDETYSRIMRALKHFEGKKFFHEYMPGYSIDKITALYKKYKIKENISAAFFDYIKEPESSSINAQRKEYQVLGDVATRLKDLAGDLNIPFITAIQLNRQGDIADSDRVARYGDVISFWMTQDKEKLESTQKRCGSYKLVIKDSRRGGGTNEDGIGFYFWKEMLRIREVPPDRQLFNFKEGEVHNEGTEEYNEELI